VLGLALAQSLLARRDARALPEVRAEAAFARYATAQQRQSWTCQACGHHLHPTAGTIFHKSSTSLHLWFYAMYLMTSTRCGISAKQLERELGVTYKTAWRMAHLIRNKLMDQGAEPLQGNGKKQRPVEIDETYYGGRRRMNRGGSRGRHHRIPVLGMVQRGGKVYATPVKSVKAETLVGQIQERILPATTVYTDTLPSYNQLGAKGYRHTRINHSASHLRRGQRPHEHHRRVLVVGEAWHRWRLPCGVCEASSGLLERIRVALQPAVRRRATASSFGIGMSSPRFVF
jgi:transposase-like protein